MLNSNSIDRIRGRNVAVLTRASSKQQTTSNELQERTTDQLVKEADLRVVHREDLYGVSGSVPGARTDIERIIAHKKKHNDFDPLVIADATRFTRAGQTHGMALVHQLRAAGIDLFFNAENLLVHDDMSAMYLSFLLMASHQTARSISRGVNLGLWRSFQAGRRPHTNNVPFGLDRLYRDADGTPLHVLRNLPDGRQELWDSAYLTDPAAERKKLRTLPANTPESYNHYQKTKGETITLVHGSEQAVATILLIFELRYARGWSQHAIAKHFNDSGMPSPHGTKWAQAAIGRMLGNPVYVGRGLCYTTTGSIYYVATEGEVRPAETSYEELNAHAKPRRKVRPEADWQEQTYDLLSDLLPEHVREPARRHIEEVLRAKADGRPKRAKKNKHWQSTFALTGLLKCAETGRPLTGRVTGGNDRPQKNRYYAISRAHYCAQSADPHLRRFVPADDLDAVVLQHLRDALLDRLKLEAAVRDVLATLKDHRQDADSPDVLNKQLRKMRHQIVSLTGDLDPDAGDDDPVVRELQRIRGQAGDIESKLKRLVAPKKLTDVDPAAVAKRFADEVEEAIHSLPEQYDPADHPRVQALLKIFASKLEVDMHTRAIYIEFAMPPALIESAACGETGVLPAVCLVKPTTSGSSHEAHDPHRPSPLIDLSANWFDGGASMGTFACTYSRRSSRRKYQQRQRCFTCSRR